MERTAALESYPTESEARSRQELRNAARLIGCGWFGTALASGITGLPLTFLLKEGMHLQPSGLALFYTLANIPIYIKPLAGILSDSVPIFGTRRRHYLVLSLIAGGAFWLLLGVVPRTFGSLVWTYIALNLFLVVTSTVLGGLMVDVGQRFHATGRVSAQRVGINKTVSLFTGPIGGFLASRPFLLTMGLSAALHFLLAPLFGRFLREERTLDPDSLFDRRAEIREQFRILFRSGTLWSAAGLVCLVVVAPGFNTPLVYYQRDTLHFSRQLIGNLGLFGGLFGLCGACLYTLFCRRRSLRGLLAGSIVIHALGTLLFLTYRSPATAILVTCLAGLTETLAILPLYDLAARATPRGSEALGYSLMMSVWNFTHALSDLLGAWFYDHLHLTFRDLVWLNAGTTVVVLIAVPFLPAVLMSRRDGERPL